MTGEIQSLDNSATEAKTEKPTGLKKCMLSRRDFLLTSGVTTATVMVFMGSKGSEAAIPASIATYPRKKIGSLSALVVDEPVEFDYPDEGENANGMLVKLGTEAGGGIGPQKDVVAFNYLCTHQGGDLTGTYKGDTKSLGACPLHLSTYDLTRFGILISGQAYQSLPQVLLELDGDDIYAVGIFGLIYGRIDNHQG